MHDVSFLAENISCLSDSSGESTDNNNSFRQGSGFMHDVSFLAENNALPAATAIGHDMLLHNTKW